MFDFVSFANKKQKICKISIFLILTFLKLQAMHTMEIEFSWDEHGNRPQKITDSRHQHWFYHAFIENRIFEKMVNIVGKR
jgi:hypothetical protein